MTVPHMKVRYCRAGVLNGILTAQRLDVHDIEGIYPVYKAFLAREQQAADRSRGATGSHAVDEMQPGTSQAAPQVECAGDSTLTNPSAAACAEHQSALQSVGMLPDAEQLAALRDYLTAATAKDCSVMIAVQASRPVHSHPEGYAAALDSLLVDAGSPAMGRFSRADGSIVAFKVRCCPLQDTCALSFLHARLRRRGSM